MDAYTSGPLHEQLKEACLSEEYKMLLAGDIEYVENQAVHCPYYVALEGVMGMDWGVIVNLSSSRFSLLTFEHDACGCPLNEEGEPEHPADLYNEEDGEPQRFALFGPNAELMAEYADCGAALDFLALMQKEDSTNRDAYFVKAIRDGVPSGPFITELPSSSRLGVQDGS